MGGILGSGAQAVGDQGASTAALTGFNYGASSPLTTAYGTSGANANNEVSQLLGNKPTTAQTTSGFQNYLQNTGFNQNLATTQAGVTNQSAANGTYNSGGTIRAMDQATTGAASTAANNYFGDVQNQANAGQQALNSVTAAGTGGGTAAANAQMAAASQAGSAAAQGTNALMGGLGSIFGIL